MVTGSHIPADRNGLKFYTPEGEITKAEESAILASLGQTGIAMTGAGTVTPTDPSPDFVARYATAFGSSALVGQRIGVWSHSAVGRDLLIKTLTVLGAEVVEVARAAHFIPIDTESIPPELRSLLAEACTAHGLAAIASTDGDGDRPLLADGTGQIVPGDVLGQITTRFLGGRIVVTPVSSNTGVESMGFAQVIRTKIGSPFVIAGMERAADDRVVGYEANGGFILGFDANGPAGPLPRLMTRDSHLPICAVLMQAGSEGLAALVARGPKRFTAADRLQDVQPERSTALLVQIEKQPDLFLAGFGDTKLAACDTTDGLRLTLTSGRIVHLRPSGNAPELRIYVEAESPAAAQALLATGLELLHHAL